MATDIENLSELIASNTDALQAQLAFENALAAELTGSVSASALRDAVLERLGALLETLATRRDRVSNLASNL